MVRLLGVMMRIMVLTVRMRGYHTGEGDDG
jgi:hypothetical protein